MLPPHKKVGSGQQHMTDPTKCIWRRSAQGAQNWLLWSDRVLMATSLFGQ